MPFTWLSCEKSTCRKLFFKQKHWVADYYCTSSIQPRWIDGLSFETHSTLEFRMFQRWSILSWFESWVSILVADIDSIGIARWTLMWDFRIVLLRCSNFTPCGCGRKYKVHQSGVCIDKNVCDIYIYSTRWKVEKQIYSVVFKILLFTAARGNDSIWQSYCSKGLNITNKQIEWTSGF